MRKILESKLLKGEFEFEQVQGKIISFINPYSYLLLRNRIEILTKLDLLLVDGISLYLILNTFFKLNSKRYSFDNTSLAKKVFKISTEKNLNVFLIGSKFDEISDAVEIIKSQYPFLKIIGFRDGYLNSEIEKEKTIQEIISLNVDVLIVGMGTPYQEEFLISARDLGFSGIGFTCGGFFHQTAKNGHEYYPRIFDVLNIRWVYRIWDEPKLVKRYFIEYPKAFVYLLWDLFF